MPRHLFVIRRCDPADAPALAALAVQLFRQAYAATHPEPALSTYLAREFATDLVRRELAATATRVWIAESQDREPIGYVWLREGAAPAGVSLPGSSPCHLRRIFVDRAWHGKGVAQALVEACVVEAGSRAADVLWLAVWQEAERPIAFYHKMGFAVVGTATFAIQDHVDQDYIMARPLTSIA